LPDLPQLCWASHLVVGRGGYNTIHELAAMGVPSLCHPGWRESDDQAERIRGASRLHGNIRLAEDDSEGLAAQILDVYRRPPHQPTLVRPWQGARQAAAALASRI
jgi:predicted glycosyltransferase